MACSGNSESATTEVLSNVTRSMQKAERPIHIHRWPVPE
jgi:hypothetical protein